VAITLVRHGPVAVDDPKITVTAMDRWIADYRCAPVANSDFDPSLQELVLRATKLVCSSEVRSQQSAELLGRVPDYISELFREADLPYPQKSRLAALKLQGSWWTALLRIMWLLGYAENAESLKDARARAEKGAELLIRLAGDGDVVLIGHGIINRLLARKLRTTGWKQDATASGSSSKPSMPWGYCRFYHD